MTATTDESAFAAENVFGKGEPNTAYAQYFTGDSFLNNLVTDPECVVGVHNVTFAPGCRNNWHIHHATSGGGQVLICTAGSGWYQEEGEDAVSLTPGAVVFTRAGVKHWHGAKADSWFSHIALGVPGENASNEWLEPVDALRGPVSPAGPGARAVRAASGPPGVVTAPGLPSREMFRLSFRRDGMLGSSAGDRLSNDVLLRGSSPYEGALNAGRCREGLRAGRGPQPR